MWSETGEQGQLLRSGEDIHAVNLDDSQATKNPTPMSTIDLPGWAGSTESLSSKGNSAGLLS
jgi:hypothetical protein